MLTAAAVIFSCTPPPDPEMSLQCAVSFFNNNGFDFKPYKGDVEDGCDDAVADYREKFWPAIQDYLKCDAKTKDIAECLVTELQNADFDVDYILAMIADGLDDRKNLDDDWRDQFESVLDDIEEKMEKAHAKCSA